jgi:hypothetical protein
MTPRYVYIFPCEFIYSFLFLSGFVFLLLPIERTTGATKPISYRSLMIATPVGITPATNPSRRFFSFFLIWEPGRFIDVPRFFLHSCCHPTSFLRLHFTCIMYHFCSATQVFPERKQPELSIHQIDRCSYCSGILIDIARIRCLCSGILIRFTPHPLVITPAAFGS